MNLKLEKSIKTFALLSFASSIFSLVPIYLVFKIPAPFMFVICTPIFVLFWALSLLFGIVALVKFNRVGKGGMLVKSALSYFWISIIGVILPILEGVYFVLLIIQLGPRTATS
jgi:hypothetical protein